MYQKFSSSFFLLFYIVGLIWEVKSLSYGRTPDRRIIGGENARPDQYPFVSAIYIKTTEGQFFCGGALLSPQWIVTSAHCANKGVTFTIVLGSVSLTSNDTTRVTVATSNYVVHPDFSPDTIEHDIALIKLHVPVELSAYISPISIPFQPLYNYVTVIMLGWGQTSDFDSSLSNDLQYVVGNAIPNVECRIFYGSQLTDNMACAVGDLNEGICTGDNGSPLVEYVGRMEYLAGIASFISVNGCESLDPSGYTRIFSYVDWITNTTDTHDKIM